MVSVESPPGRRELPCARVLLLPAILMAVATGAAVALVAPPARAAVGWCGAVATLLVIATAAEAVRRGRTLRHARAEHARHTAYLEQRITAHEQRIAAHDSEWTRLAKELVPAAIDEVQSGRLAREVVRQLGMTDPAFRDLPAPQVTVINTVLKIIEHEQVLRDSVQRSFVDINRRIQAIVHQQANELREMEEDHGRNPEVFDDLLRLDHGTSLIGRLADSVTVLGRGRPGRQWPEPVALYSVLRGAMSRILEYRRISLDSIAKVNVKGTAVEPVIHALAEILDNATRYSPPASKVHVTASEVQTGVAIEIEDSGVNLSEESRLRIEGMLEDAMTGVDLEELGNNPRLGLAVVGRLCKAHNMQISLRASAYGGVRAILVVPGKMLTEEPGVGLAHGIGATSVPIIIDGLRGPARPEKKRRPTAPRIPGSPPPEPWDMDDDVPVVTEWTANGLPQRRSKVKTSLADRLAQQAADLKAEREAAARGEETPWTPIYRELLSETEPEEEKRLPGLWVEDFWEGLKKGLPPGTHPTDFTRNPTKYLYLLNDDAAAPTEADDEGDPK
ncbi:sensor histidine kinase KdpD [Streptomyces sp. TRM68367]|uniref:sensor histidine kinase n=1 Tax=Streptomyces sp. TRM68367 TaxID=2758415 RepID=UPI00165A817C|nr:ATP-binding protein [Streptomyces sp. TRM68367]MBC9725887.1 sensor histidine kinase [Streptomyces sp. TRM68367]